MKKKLLVFTFALFGLGIHSQVILSIEEPASIASIYNSDNLGLTYVAAGVGWGVSDLTLPANAVTGEVVLAKDLSATSDLLMCESATLGSLTGKIALLYRGACDFSSKAFNAQNAGAIAVIIVNNAEGN